MIRMSTVRRLPGMIARRVLLLVVWINLVVPFSFGWLDRPRAEPAGQEAITARRGATRRYLALRDPTVDLMLPEGVGGTRIVDVLPDSVDGVAYADRALIEIVEAAVGDSTPRGEVRRGDIVEMHERAHLLDAAAPELVDDLIALLPPPDPESYAATNDGEHFAEMLAHAWEILALQRVDGFCADLTGALQSAERQVPGTAGAMLWLRPTWERAHGPTDTTLIRTATALSQGTADAWQAIAAVVEHRRRDDGRFTSWSIPTRADAVRSARVQLLRGPHLWERMLGWVLLPAATVAGLLS